MLAHARDDVVGHPILGFDLTLRRDQPVAGEGADAGQKAVEFVGGEGHGKELL